MLNVAVVFLIILLLLFSSVPVGAGVLIMDGKMHVKLKVLYCTVMREVASLDGATLSYRGTKNGEVSILSLIQKPADTAILKAFTFKRLNLTTVTNVTIINYANLFISAAKQITDRLSVKRNISITQFVAFYEAYAVEVRAEMNVCMAILISIFGGK